MKATQYAITDIETTGGNASGSRITEIAIIIHDGTKIIERWETLVNPEQEIPLPIFALTGINNDMVRHAPIFDDIAEKVMELLSGRIFVAHNVNFDYSFIRHQLEQSGFKWTAKKLCTVRAARKIKPGLASYSLGNLCRALGINIENRHRAGGDADATAILFSRLLEWDTEAEIEKMLKKASQDQRLPPNVPHEDFEQLPEKPGVYYFYNAEKKVVYVGKAVNLKKRVASHFSGHKVTPQRQHFLRDIHSISFETCATELMALLLECTEIRKLWPIYNKALKRFEGKYGLYEYEARNGYRYLAVGKLHKQQSCIRMFYNEYDGIYLLLDLAARFNISHRFCIFGKPAEGEIIYQPNLASLPSVEDHNQRVTEAINSLSKDRPSFAILDKGRHPDERSCIWVENGDFYGMGYVGSDVGFKQPSEIREYVTQYKSNQYLMQLVNAFVKKYPGKVVTQSPLAATF
ncbi:exonuclease domain-containing protein [Flavobacterium pallidum]|uniref:DNA polymerase III subunit epsilon n=1 Tax=Flavobacterium pallidum TaxID=2172098 RepID=A0A2S1SEC3_9FLAO|nr:exonuclease domain-containing protein [Flavobacterium pallidum]AWI24741.1 DNA polymerase III subunit epsilon [Flavobacterium pallidum]